MVSDQLELVVTLVRGLAGKCFKHKLVIKGLGLKRPGHQVVLKDHAANRGMIQKVQHMVDVQVRKVKP